MDPLYGLVACGGRSSRMGFDKSTIIYHGIPQRYYVYHMLELYCEKVFISCNREQRATILPGYRFIEDTEKAQHGAPMVALISAFEQYPKASFLLVGCDYPFLQSGEIARLVAARLSDRPAICYVNSSGLEEPLIAMYENAVQQKLIEAYSKGNHSLRMLLQSVDALHCVSSSESAIMSVDDRKTYEEIQQQIFQH